MTKFFTIRREKTVQLLICVFSCKRRFYQICALGEPWAKEAAGGVGGWRPSVPLWAPVTGEKSADFGERGSGQESGTHCRATRANEYPVWRLEEQVPGQQVMDTIIQWKINKKMYVCIYIICVSLNKLLNLCCLLRVMAEELTNARAALQRQTREAQGAIQDLLLEREEFSRDMMLTHR